MKKILTMLAAAVAAFSLSSCNREQFEDTMPSEEGIQLNLTVAELDGTADADTKAVKKGWAKGDKINIWYDDNLGQNPDLVIAYDGSKWAVDHSAAVSGKAPSANGKLVAIYVDGSLSDFTYSGEENSCTFNAPRFGSVVDGVNRPCRMPLVSYVDRTDYSFASDILTSNLTNWVFGGANVQVVISGLAAGDEWVLSCDKFRAPNRIAISNNNPAIRVAVTSASAYGNYAIANKNADGSAFMYHYSGTDTDFTFTLFNARTSEKLVYSVSGKSLDATGYKLNAIKIPFSKFKAIKGTAKRTGNIDVNWVQLWAGGPKFAEYNVGAEHNKAEDYGGYYCWGSSIDKDPDSAYNSGDDALSGTDDTATKLWGNAWRMPTQTELQALLDNCDAEWTTVNRVEGRKYTGKVAPYNSNSVFLPAAGWTYRLNNVYEGPGHYWSSTPNGSDWAYRLNFDSDLQLMHDSPCSYGYSVRAVLAE